MPWSAQSFKSKHNKKLSPKHAQHAASVANAVLRRTGDEGQAIRVGNFVGNHHHRGGKKR